MTTTVETPTDTSPDALDKALAAATAAAPVLAASAPAERAGWIRAAADALDSAVDQLVPMAIGGVPPARGRLRGEVGRSSGQLRMFADALDDGAMLELVLDSADPDAAPCRGPTCAGCWSARAGAGVRGQQLPVRVQRLRRRHRVGAGGRLPGGGQGASGPPRTSYAHRTVWPRRWRRGPADGDFRSVTGVDAGVERSHPRIKAAGFTGSVPGGPRCTRSP